MRPRKPYRRAINRFQRARANHPERRWVFRATRGHLCAGKLWVLFDVYDKPIR